MNTEIMQTNPVVLMVSGQSAHFDSLRRAVTETGCKCDARRADDLPSAMARVAGGGVKVVVLDVSGWRNNPAKLDTILKFPKSSRGLPFVIWSESGDPGLTAIAQQAGAAGCVASGDSLLELRRLLSEVMVSDEPSMPRPAVQQVQARASIIAVMGVKGGVGTTTVAVNVAAALADRGSVILAEIRPMFGGLQSHFNPGRFVRGFSNRRTADNSAGAARSMLWPAPNVAALRVLFGPQTSDDCGEIDLPQALKWLEAISAEADFVVLDLPFSLTQANVGILAASHHLAVVIEPAPESVRIAGLTLEGIRTWEKAPTSIGAVVVRRTPDGVPLAPAEIESGLGVPILKVIPPAAALCTKAERSHIPLIKGDPDSFAADAFITLARCFDPGKSLPK